MPIVPRGGLVTPPSKITDPALRPSKPAKMDSAVDFPALGQR